MFVICAMRGYYSNTDYDLGFCSSVGTSPDSICCFGATKSKPEFMYRLFMTIGMAKVPNINAIHTKETVHGGKIVDLSSVIIVTSATIVILSGTASFL